MYQKPQLHYVLSWPFIITFLLIMWPIGIVLLLIRMNKDKTAALRVGQVLKVFSYIIFGFMSFIIFVMLLTGTDTDPRTWSVISFFLLLALTLYLISRILIAKANKTKLYMSAIINDHERDLGNLARMLNKPIDRVSKDVQKLIDQGLLKEAMINQTTHTIVLPQDRTSAARKNSETMLPIDEIMEEFMNHSVRLHVTATQQPPAQPSITQCKFCGANNSVSNNTGECEYCGSPL